MRRSQELESGHAEYVAPFCCRLLVSGDVDGDRKKAHRKALVLVVQPCLAFGCLVDLDVDLEHVQVGPLEARSRVVLRSKLS